MISMWVNVPDYTESYIGKTERRLGVRAHEHAETDKNSHLLSHQKNSGHRAVTLHNFQYSWETL